MFHFGLMMAELQQKHAAWKLTTEFHLIVDIICCTFRR